MNRLESIVELIRKAVRCIASADPLALIPVQIYLPFLAVGLYMRAYDACDHCRKAWFENILVFPGILSSMAVRSIFGRPIHVDHGGGMAAVWLALTFAAVMGVSRLMPESIRKPFGWLVVMPVFMIEALICRAMIQM
jgi:hypothetical protein